MKIFVESGFRSLRVAGSGVSDDSPCDLLAGKINGKKYAIECKTCKDKKRYIDKKQIEDFLVFRVAFLSSEIRELVAVSLAHAAVLQSR